MSTPKQSPKHVSLPLFSFHWNAGAAGALGGKLLEQVGPGVSLEVLAGGRATFQSYLERCNSQTSLLAAGTLDKQACSALRYTPAPPPRTEWKEKV